MKKNIGSIVDELIITNIKIFYLIEKVQKDEHTRQEAKKIQDLNKYRSRLVSEVNKFFDIEDISNIKI